MQYIVLNALMKTVQATVTIILALSRLMCDPLSQVILFPIVAPEEQREVYAAIDVTLLPIDLVCVV